MREQRVTVVVADDHPVYREGVVAAIRARPELELLGAFDNGRDVLEAIREQAPRVALLDVHMPELGGQAVLNAVTRDGLATGVVLLSASVDSDLVYDAIAHGARGYLSKMATREQISDAVLAAARGEVVLDRELQAGLADQIVAREKQGRTLLSPREQEVLKLTAQGLSAPDIGRQLHLSAATVKSHLGSLYDKLGVKDRAAAVAEGMRRGLVE